MKNKRFLSIFLAVVFLFAITTKQTQAKWVDKSNELGLVSDGEMIALAAVATVGVGVLVYVLVKKNKSKKTTSLSLNQMNGFQVNLSESALLGLGSDCENNSLNPRQNVLMSNDVSFMEKIETTSRNIPVDVMVTPLASNSNFAVGNTNGIQVGIRIRF